MALRSIIAALFATTLSLCHAQPRLRAMNELQNDLEKTTPDSTKADLLLDLALSYVLKPGEYASDLDSAISFIKKAENINSHYHSMKIEAKTFYVYSFALREGGKTEAGKQCIEKSLAIYKTMSAPAEMGEAWLELSRYYSIYNSDEETKKKRECFEQALSQYRAAGDKERQADALKELGDIDQYMFNFTPAMKELNEALTIYRSIGYTSLQGVYDLMGAIANWKGDYPDAVRFGLLAVKTAEQTNDTTIQLCTLYNRLGQAYDAGVNYEQAESCMKKALAIALKYKDKVAAEIVLINFCSINSFANKSEEAVDSIHSVEAIIKKPWDYIDSLNMNQCYITAYVVSKKYEKASKYVVQMIDLLKKSSSYMPVNNYAYLIYYFLGTHQYAEAIKYADIYLKQSIVEQFKNGQMGAYKLKSKIDSALGDYKSALINYKIYQNLNDSVLNEAASFQFAQMEVEHETETKEQNFILLKKEDQLKTAALQKTTLLRNLFVAGTILLFVVLALGYSRYLQNQKTNRLLQSQQEIINKSNHELQQLNEQQTKLLKEKEWLIKETHHRVKNNLQMVVSLLNAQTEFLDHPSALNAIKESRERMQAIAILHQKLYQQENTTRINMRSYISELVENIKSSFADAHRIYFNVDVDNINLDISQSVPLGLILNEGITNAVKYAYPKNEKGIIYVSLQHMRAQQLELRIKDQGKGLPADVDVNHAGSLGLQLIKLFAEQLEGELNFINNGGLEMRLSFKEC